MPERRGLVEVGHACISLRRQCHLLGLPRSSYYYQPVRESDENLAVMRALDELYTRTPFYGSRRMMHELRDLGHLVNRKRVQRLSRLMGLETIFPKKRPQFDGAQHRIFPYLLNGVVVNHANQVWSTDITYIRLRGGFVYLVAVLDWYSRFVLSWELSNTLDASFCVAAARRALMGCRPSIFNTDQGSQFTCSSFVDLVLENGVQLSMDGRGRAFDNIFIERLWRTVKYEEVYLRDYESVPDALASIGRYLRFYNDERKHQSLGYRTPRAVYHEQAAWN